MWQDKKYQFISLFIYLHEDHLIWDEVGFAGRQFTLYYTDIISVSGGNAGKHLGGTSRFEINTAGQSYKYSSSLGAFAGLEECMQIINERIHFFRSNGVGSANSAGFANTININPDNIEPTITRINNFLEDGEWDKVYAYSNAALDYFPTDYRLYQFLLLADMRCKSMNALKDVSVSFASNSNYKKLDRYADESLKKELKDILEHIEKEPIYKQACKTSDDKQAVDLFRRIRGYKDSNSRIETLQNKIRASEEIEKQKKEEEKAAKYAKAVALEAKAQDLNSYKEALDAFDELRKAGYKDSNTKYYNLKKKYDELVVEKKYSDALSHLEKGTPAYAKIAKAEFESLEKDSHYKDSAEKVKEAQAIIDKAGKDAKKKIKIVACVIAIILVVACVIGVTQHNKQNAEAYASAMALYEQGDYEQALTAFEALGSYKDSQEYSEKCIAEIEKASELQGKYDEALSSCKEGEFTEAIEQLKSLGDFSDSKNKIEEIESLEATYNEMESLIEKGDLWKAKEKLNEVIATGLLDKEKTDILSSLIDQYIGYAGTFVFESGKKNAITQGGQDVDEITIYVKGINTDQSKYKTTYFTPELLIEYDGGSLKCERYLTENTHKYHYYMHDTKVLVEDEVVTRYSAKGGEAADRGKVIIITDYEHRDSGSDYDNFSGYYKRK